MDFLSSFGLIRKIENVLVHIIRLMKEQIEARFYTRLLFSQCGINQFEKYLAKQLASNNTHVNCSNPGGLFNNQAERFLETIRLKYF